MSHLLCPLRPVQLLYNVAPGRGATCFARPCCGNALRSSNGGRSTALLRVMGWMGSIVPRQRPLSTEPSRGRAMVFNQLHPSMMGPVHLLNLRFKCCVKPRRGQGFSLLSPSRGGCWPWPHGMIREAPTTQPTRPWAFGSGSSRYRSCCRSCSPQHPLSELYR